MSASIALMSEVEADAVSSFAAIPPLPPGEGRGEGAAVERSTADIYFWIVAPSPLPLSRWERGSKRHLSTPLRICIFINPASA